MNKLIRFFCMFTVSLFFCMGSFARDDFNTLILFGTEDCQDCARLKQRWQKEADRHPGRQLIIVNVEHEANFLMLVELEKALAVTETGDLPAIYSNGKILYGAESILRNWTRLLAAGGTGPLPACLSPLMQKLGGDNPSTVFIAGPVGPADASPTAAPPQPATRPQFMAMLDQEGCSKCSRQQLVLKNIQRQIPGLKVDHFDLNSPAGQGLLHLLKIRFKLPPEQSLAPPVLVWPDSWTEGKNVAEKDILQRLETPGDPASERGPFWRQLSIADLEKLGARQSQSLYANFTLALVLMGGLIDGINPCAFAVIIFLVSYLSVSGQTRKSVAIVGGSFCLGVFLAYFLIGLGFSALLDQVKSINWIKPVLFHALALVAAICAGIHLRDIYIYRKTGRLKDMSGGLSTGTTRKIHAWIRKMVILPLLIPAGIALGAIVSLLELACTGQIYLPILSIINRSGANARAVILLAAYCGAFVLPLVLVTILAARGTRIQTISNWARRNMILAKSLMAVFFIVLTVVMIKLA